MHLCRVSEPPALLGLGYREAFQINGLRLDHLRCDPDSDGKLNIDSKEHLGRLSDLADTMMTPCSFERAKTLASRSRHF